MANVAAIGAASTALSRLEFETAYQAATLRQTRDAMDLQGQQAVQLIQSAALPPGDIGQNLNLLA